MIYVLWAILISWLLVSALFCIGICKASGNASRKEESKEYLQSLLDRAV